MEQQTLHGDGISVSLLHNLWCKTRNEANSSLFRIPDTVIFQLGQPSHWYFTGVDGIILRKRKQNLTVERIEKELLKQSGIEQSDVIAYFIETTAHEKVRLSHIDYFDRKSLHEFLFNTRKERTGILQRFIEPKGSNNSMMCAIWTPQVFLLERRVNKHKLHDKRFGLFERAVTYDGPEIYSASTPVRGRVLSRKIQEICEEIVNHVGQVSERQSQITRLVVNFKLDASDRVDLLWSSSIRLDSFGEVALTTANHPVNLESVVRIPEGTKLAHAPNHNVQLESAPNQVEKSSPSCLSCAGTMIHSNSHCVSYKTIILHFEQLMLLSRANSENCGKLYAPWPPHADMIEAAGNIGFGTIFGDVPPSKGEKRGCGTEEELCIPPIIRATHPRLKIKGYQRYRKDLLFLHKSVRLCEDCFLAYAELACNSFHIIAPIRLSDETYGKEHCWTDFRSSKTTSTSWLPVPLLNDTKKNLARNAVAANQILCSSRAGEKVEVCLKSNSIEKLFPKTPHIPPPITDSINQYLNEHRLLVGGDEGKGSAICKVSDVLPWGKCPVEDSIMRRKGFFRKEFATASLPTRNKNPLAHLVDARIALESSVNLDVNVSRDGKKPQQVNPYRQEMRFVGPPIAPIKASKKKHRKHLKFSMNAMCEDKDA